MAKDRKQKPVIKRQRKMSRKYRGVWIAKWIADDQTLTAQQKITLGEIDNLDGEDGCWAMNEHFSILLSITPARAGRIISELVNSGRIIRHTIPSSEGTKRYLAVVSEDELHPPESTGGHLSESTGGHPSETTDGPPVENDVTHLSKTTYPPVENDVSLIGREYIENTRERTTPLAAPLSLPDFLNPKKTKGEIYLTACHGYPLPSSGFYEWFENEVLKRFPKFNSNILNEITLKDWDRMVFGKYGAEISTDAVFHSLNRTKGTLPGASEVAVAAKKIFNKQKQAEIDKKETQRRIENANKKPEVPFSSYLEMPADEIVKEYLGASEFVKGLIKRKRPDVLDLINTRKAVL